MWVMAVSQLTSSIEAVQMAESASSPRGLPRKEGPAPKSQSLKPHAFFCQATGLQMRMRGFSESPCLLMPFEQSRLYGVVPALLLWL